MDSAHTTGACPPAGRTPTSWTLLWAVEWEPGIRADIVWRTMGSLIKKRRKRMRKKKHKKMLRRTRHQRQRGK